MAKHSVTTRRSSAASTAHTFEATPASITVTTSHEVLDHPFNRSFKVGKKIQMLRERNLSNGERAGAIVCKSGLREQLNHSISEPQFAAHHAYSQRMRRSIPSLAIVEESVNQKREKSKKLKSIVCSFKQGYFSRINKTAAAQNLARRFGQEADICFSRKDKRLNERTLVCNEIVKIYPEIQQVSPPLNQIQRDIKEEKELRVIIKDKVQEEEDRISLLRNAIAKLKRLISLHDRENNQLRAKLASHSTNLGRKVHRIGLQEHSNDMFYFNYCKHIGDKARALSPNMTIARAFSPPTQQQRRASSGVIQR